MVDRRSDPRAKDSPTFCRAERVGQALLGSTCVVRQIQAVYWTHLPERDTHAMIGWTVPSSRASVGKGQMQQIEQYLVHLQMKKGQGMPLSRLEERYLHDHEFLEERAAALVHEQLGGRMGLVTDLNKFSETLDNMPPIDEENDAYGLMPVETDYQTGYHVSLERRNPPPSVSTARNVARSWGGSSGSGTQR